MLRSISNQYSTGSKSLQYASDEESLHGPGLGNGLDTLDTILNAHALFIAANSTIHDMLVRHFLFFRRWRSAHGIGSLRNRRHFG